jgi:hypothetical protein
LLANGNTPVSISQSTLINTAMASGWKLRLISPIASAWSTRCSLHGGVKIILLQAHLKERWDRIHIQFFIALIFHNEYSIKYWQFTKKRITIFRESPLPDDS